MKIVVTGGGGFLGRRVARGLLERNAFAGPGGRAVPIERLVLFDAAPPAPGLPADVRVETVTGDIGDAALLRSVVTPDTGALFHLAAVVSAGAEADFDLGLRVNLDGTRAVLEAARALGTCPRVVFASSIAVYGGDMPPVVDDGTALVPQTSYGAQKAIGELLVADYARRGFVDGRTVRLPTVVVRPGRPNKAASTWASSILREPLQGETAVCPVEPDQEMYMISPRRAAAALLRAAELPAEAWAGGRTVVLPGITRSVRDMLAALARVAGPAVAARVRFEPDADIRRIISGWAARVDARRGLAMGFEPDESLEAMIRAFIDDELGGRFVA